MHPDFQHKTIASFSTSSQKNTVIKGPLALVARSIRALALAVIVSLGSMTASISAHALELGLTPSQVYSTWTNINAALVALARTMPGTAEWHAEIANMHVRAFTGKSPHDVFTKVNEFEIRAHKGWAHGETMQEWKIRPVDQGVTPSIVFLSSGHILGGVVSRLIDRSPRSQLVSQFFTRHSFSEKKPSDVFSLVDLALRRLDRILAKQGV